MNCFPEELAHCCIDGVVFQLKPIHEDIKMGSGKHCRLLLSLQLEYIVKSVVLKLWSHTYVNIDLLSINRLSLFLL